MAQIFSFGQVVKDNPELRDALSDPARSRADKATLVSDLLGSKALPATVAEADDTADDETVLPDGLDDLPSDDELAAHLLTDAHLAAHPGWFYDLAEPGVLALSLLPESADFAAGITRLCAAIDALDDA